MLEMVNLLGLYGRVQRLGDSTGTSQLLCFTVGDYFVIFLGFLGGMMQWDISRAAQRDSGEQLRQAEICFKAGLRHW
jgi:hypothetical protein